MDGGDGEGAARVWGEEVEVGRGILGRGEGARGEEGLGGERGGGCEGHFGNIFSKEREVDFSAAGRFWEGTGEGRREFIGVEWE